MYLFNHLASPDDIDKEEVILCGGRTALKRHPLEEWLNCALRHK